MLRIARMHGPTGSPNLRKSDRGQSGDTYDEKGNESGYRVHAVNSRWDGNAVSICPKPAFTAVNLNERSCIPLFSIFIASNVLVQPICIDKRTDFSSAMDLPGEKSRILEF